MKKTLLHTLFAIFCLQNVSAQSYHLVKDLYPAFNTDGIDPSNNSSLTEYKGKVYFIGNNGTLASNLFATDGTEEGTKPVVPTHPGVSPNVSDRFLIANNLLFFTSGTATNGVSHGTEVWVTDGTEAGTKMVRDVNTTTNGGEGYYSKILASNGDKVFFRGYDGAFGFWITDGTEAGTFKLTGNTIAPIAKVSVVDKKFYFLKNVGTSSSRFLPWVSDGTVAGTFALSTMEAGRQNFVPYKGSTYFAAGSTATGIELAKTDGTAAGTSIAIDLEQGKTASNPNNLFVFKDHLYFVATLKNVPGLFKYDGTTATFVDTLKIYGSHIIYKDELYIVGNNYGAIGNELHKLNANNEIVAVKNIYPGMQTPEIAYDGLTNDVFNNYNTPPLHIYDDKLYFSAFDGTDPYQNLWTSDGTEAGTLRITGKPDPGQIGDAKNMLSSSIGFFFVYRTSYIGSELYMMDPIVTHNNDATLSTAFQILPNPNNGSFEVRCNEDVLSVQIMDLQGKNVWEHAPTHGISSSTSTFQTSLAPGVYLAKLQTPTQTLVQRVVIQ